jgi:hypothetical protein
MQVIYLAFNLERVSDIARFRRGPGLASEAY